jgi:cob(I)alamin adenosyltransferase
MDKLKKGFIQIYTGNGKGKTTAALGQAVRAAGNGFRSYILMLMKEFPYNEVSALSSLKEFITIEQVGKDDYVYRKELPSNEEVEKAKQALERAGQNMKSGDFEIIILDEVLVAVYFGLITVDDILPLINEKPVDIELILTGRYCPQELIERADLVTEMKEVKHYYQKGILARRGIES